MTPKDVFRQDDRRMTYQYRLLARGVPIYWWSDVQFEDDPKTFAAVHLCAVNGVFKGRQGGLAFNPSGAADSGTQQAIDGNLGQALPWPAGPLTRAQAAVFV